jgi:hypothetical protein
MDIARCWLRNIYRGFDTRRPEVPNRGPEVSYMVSAVMPVRSGH